MKLDRNNNPDGRGKYAIIQLRKCKYPLETTATVPTNGGTAFDVDGVTMDGVRLLVTAYAHLVCETARKPMVVQLTTETDDGSCDMIQNINGRCEDAPCCGCCYP